MLTTASSISLRPFCRGQRGQIFALLALLLAVLGGMTAVAVDLGSFAADRRDLQNAADAIALAASQDLPDSSIAQAAATQWAINNDIDLADMTVTVIPQNLPSEPNPKVQVELERGHSFTFARLIGISSATVGASAAAIKTSPAGGDGIIPLSVTQDALEGATFGEVVVLKYDSNNITTGNTGPIRIDGPGTGNCTSSDKYCEGLMFGSENVVCASGADPSYCTSATSVDTEPGNKVGPTQTAIEYRLDTTGAACSEFEGANGVFEDDPSTSEPGVYSIRPECNPFLPGGYSSQRILIIPVISNLCTGSCSVSVVDFALFFLEGFGSGGCRGNDCEIIGRFVRVDQNVGLLAGTYNPDSSNQFVRLVY